MSTKDQKPLVVTGIGEDNSRLGEQTQLPSVELVYLADKWLGRLKATHVFSSMAPGWNQAMAKAAFRRSLPFTVVIPGQDYQAGWASEVREYYQKLVRFTEKIEVVPGGEGTSGSLPEYTRWMIDRSDLLLVLWAYEFHGRVYQAVDYAIKNDKQVVNLWEEWSPLRSMRTRHVLG